MTISKVLGRIDGKLRRHNIITIRNIIAVSILVLGVAIPAWSNEAPGRFLDQPPQNQGEIKPNIPAEYKDLVKSFDEYWGALKARDYDKAYLLESSAFQKTTTLSQYKGSFKREVELKSVRALSVKKINEKEVIVKGSAIVKALIGGKVHDVLKMLNSDRWIKENAGWKHVPEAGKRS